MKSRFFSLNNALGTITVCTFFIWYGGTLAAAAAESGLDTAKIESMTGHRARGQYGRLQRGKQHGRQYLGRFCGHTG